jgi:hypothetical protein
MRADRVIRREGFKAIFSKFNPVEAERFLVIPYREGADYTKWQKDISEDMTVKELSKKAMKRCWLGGAGRVLRQFLVSPYPPRISQLPFSSRPLLHLCDVTIFGGCASFLHLTY